MQKIDKFWMKYRKNLQKAWYNISKQERYYASSCFKNRDIVILIAYLFVATELTKLSISSQNPRVVSNQTL